MPLQRRDKGAPCRVSGMSQSGCRIRQFLRLCRASASHNGTLTGMLGSKGPYAPCVHETAITHGPMFKRQLQLSADVGNTYTNAPQRAATVCWK